MKRLEPIETLDDLEAIIEILNPEFDQEPADALLRLLLYLSDRDISEVDRIDMMNHAMQLALIRTPAFREFVNTYIAREE